MPLRRQISATDTAVTAAYEDAAALLGNAIALAGLEMHWLPGSPAPNAAAGIAIGLLLAGIGLRLAARTRALLTGRSEFRPSWTASGTCWRPTREVAAVGQAASVYMGPPAPDHGRDPARRTPSPACACVSSCPSSADA